MLCLILLLPLFGDFATAAVNQSSPSEGLTSVFEGEAQLVASLKTALKDSNLMHQLAMDAKKFNDYSQTYSHSVLPLLSELRSIIISSEDNIFDATRPVHGWCSFIKDLIEAYTSLFHQTNSESIEAQNQIIQSIFADDTTTMVSNELNKLSNNLNRASSTLSSIMTQLDADFSEQSSFFELALHNEFIKEKNKRYTPDLIKKVVAVLMKLETNPAQVYIEVKTANRAIKIAETALHHQQVLDDQHVLDDQQVLDLVSALPRANQQDQQRQEPVTEPARNEQLTPTPTTIDPQQYLPYKNRVSSQFSQTKEFFNNFERHLNEVIRHTNEVKSGLAQYDRLAETSKVASNMESVQLTAAQKNEMKYAAQTLSDQCKKFISTPLKQLL